jgi:hypothetical protein
MHQLVFRQAHGKKATRVVFSVHRLLSNADTLSLNFWQILLVYNQHDTSVVYSMNSTMLANCVSTGRTEQILNVDATLLAAFRNAIVNAHVHNLSDLPRDQLRSDWGVVTRAGNIRVGPFPSNRKHNAVDGLTLHLHNQYVWASAAHKTTLAVSGSNEIFVHDMQDDHAFNVRRLPDLDSECRALDWLDDHTIAFEQRVAREKRTQHGICKTSLPSKEATRDKLTFAVAGLWDIRSGGRTWRISCSKPVTGIRNPDSAAGGNTRLLVADNTRITLYDMRNNSRPVFSLAHRHQGPQIQWDVASDIIAALDADNVIQMYSLRTGKPIQALPAPPPPPPSILKADRDAGRSGVLMTKVRWLMDGASPVIQACQNYTIIRWKYGGAADDEA